MKKNLWSLMTAVLFVVAVLEVGTVTHISAATTKTGTTVDGFSYKVLSKDGTVEITGYKGKKKKLVIPNKIDGKKVTRIGKKAFNQNKNIVSVKFPDTVEKMEVNSFKNCEKLQSIEFGKNMQEIGEEDTCLLSYIECDDIEMSIGKNFKEFKVSDENQVYYVKDGVLFKRIYDENVLIRYPEGKKTKKYIIPDDTEYVDVGSFCNSNFSTLVIPESVKNISVENWLPYGKLEKYVVDESNERYCAKEGVLFERDQVNRDELILLQYPKEKKDSSYMIPEGVKSIGDYSFYGNKYLEKVTMPKTILYTCDNAFGGCINLKSAVVSGNLGDSAFWSCKSLREVELDESVTYIGEAAFFFTDSLKIFKVRNKDCEINDLPGVINKTVIYGYENSTAEALAKKYGYQFKLIGSEEGSSEDASEGTITKDTVKLSKTSYTYDGKAKKPGVIVKDKFGNKLLKDDYKVIYKNNKNVGIATVKIELTCYYDGTIKTNFTIKPPKSAIVKTTSLKKGVLLQWKGVKPSQIDGYEIQYSKNNNFDTENTKKVIVNQKDADKKKIGNLSEKQTYYVRIRSYKVVEKDGKTERIYSKWSDVKKVKTL